MTFGSGPSTRMTYVTGAITVMSIAGRYFGGLS